MKFKRPNGVFYMFLGMVCLIAGMFKHDYNISIMGASLFIVGGVWEEGDK